jgi:hypothetical protein
MSINIYKLSCNVTELDYYGSTSETLHRRLQGHVKDYKRYINGEKTSTYTTSYKIIENNDYEIELMERCEEKDKNDRESYYIRNFDCVNKVIPNGTAKERMERWLIDNKEHKKQQDKEYYEKNRDKCIEKSKDWYEKNIEHKKEYDIKYYEKNKEKYSNRGKERIRCDICDIEITRSSKWNHEKSITHQKKLFKKNFS